MKLGDVSKPADNTDRCSRCELVKDVYGCTADRCVTVLRADEMLAIVRKAAEGSCGEPDGCAPRWLDDEICEHRMAIAFLKKFDEGR